MSYHFCLVENVHALYFILLLSPTGDNLQCPPLDRPFKSKVLQHVPENVPGNPFDKAAVGMVSLIQAFELCVFYITMLHIHELYNLEYSYCVFVPSLSLEDIFICTVEFFKVK